MMPTSEVLSSEEIAGGVQEHCGETYFGWGLVLGVRDRQNTVLSVRQLTIKITSCTGSNINSTKALLQMRRKHSKITFFAIILPLSKAKQSKAKQKLGWRPEPLCPSHSIDKLCTYHSIHNTNVYHSCYVCCVHMYMAMANSLSDS